MVELLSDLSFEKKVEKPKPTLAELLSDLSFESKPSIKSVDKPNEQVMVDEPKKHETNSCLTKAQKRTDETVKLYESLGRPSVKSFKDIVANNLTGTRVTTQDVNNNAHLLDADGSRSAAIIHDKPNKESNSKVVSAIGELIYADIVYDDYKQPYLLTHDRDNMLRTITGLKTKSAVSLCSGFDAVINLYNILN